MSNDKLKLIKDWGLAAAIALGVMLIFNLFQGGSSISGTAPDFTIKSLSDDEYHLQELRGQTVVLNFWATWCGPCRHEIPALAKFSVEHPEVVLLGISLDSGMSNGTLKRKSKQLGINYPVLYDKRSTIGNLYGINTLPTTVVINPEGEIVGHWQGAISKRYLEGMIE